MHAGRTRKGGLKWVDFWFSGEVGKRKRGGDGRREERRGEEFIEIMA